MAEIEALAHRAKERCVVELVADDGVTLGVGRDHDRGHSDPETIEVEPLTAKDCELVNDKVSYLGAVVLDNLVRLTGGPRKRFLGSMQP